MNPEELNEQEQRIARMADAMLARGKPPEEIQAFVNRAMARIQTSKREMADAGSAGNLFARGLTSGFADEIAGAGDALWAMAPGGQSPSQAYRSTRDAIRTTNAAYEEENPGKALLAELAGGITQGVALGAGAAAAAPSRLGALASSFVPKSVQGITSAGGARGAAARLGQAVAAGGAAGGLAGFGGAEGDLGDRLRGARTGAVGGMAGGAVFHGLGSAASGVAKRVGFAPRDPNAGGIGGTIGRAQQGLRRATGIGGLTPDESAAGRVGDAVEKSRRSLDDVFTNSDFDESSVLADTDIGGVQAARLAGSARRLGDEAPEVAERTFGNRTRQRPVKLQGDVARLSGQGRINIEDEADALIAKARADAKPLYEQLRQFPAVRDERINEALTLIPEGRLRDIWGTVRNLAKEDGRNLSRELFDETGALKFDLEPSEMDLLKRGLDEVLFDGSTPSIGGLTGAERRLLSRARQLIVDAAEDATGGETGVYRQARQAFAGPASIREALQSGGELRNMDEATLERTTRGMTGSQREGFRRGGVESIRSDLAKQPEGRLGLARNFTSTTRRAQTDEAFGGAAKSWRDLIDGEVAREQTEGIVMRGSPTAERLADDEMAQLATNVPRSLSDLAGMAVQRAERTAIRGATAREMDAAMNLLSRNLGTPADRAEVLALLQAGKKARAELAARAALRRAGAAGTMAPAFTGSDR